MHVGNPVPRFLLCSEKFRICPLLYGQFIFPWLRDVSTVTACPLPAFLPVGLSAESPAELPLAL